MTDERIVQTESGERYTLVERLGRGAIATVWKAQKADGSLAAVKVAHSALHPDLRRRFDTEYETLQRILAEDEVWPAGPHLPPLPAFIQRAGKDALVTELVAADTLTAQLEGGPGSPARQEMLVEPAYQYTWLLDLLHNRVGVGQPDRKAGDLRWDAANKRLVVLDWNVVAEVDRAPEDVYRFGEMWYGLLLDTPPVLGGDLAANPGWEELSAAWRRVLEACLRVNREARPTASGLLEMVADLREAYHQPAQALLERGQVLWQQAQEGRAAGPAAQPWLFQERPLHVRLVEADRQVSRVRGQREAPGQGNLDEALYALGVINSGQARRYLNLAAAELESDPVGRLQVARWECLYEALQHIQGENLSTQWRRLMSSTLTPAVQALEAGRWRDAAAGLATTGTALPPDSRTRQCLSGLEAEVRLRELLDKADDLRQRQAWGQAAEVYGAAQGQLKAIAYAGELAPFLPDLADVQAACRQLAQAASVAEAVPGVDWEQAERAWRLLDLAGRKGLADARALADQAREMWDERGQAALRDVQDRLELGRYEDAQKSLERAEAELERDLRGRLQAARWRCLYDAGQAARGEGLSDALRKLMIVELTPAVSRLETDRWIEIGFALSVALSSLPVDSQTRHCLASLEAEVELRRALQEAGDLQGHGAFVQAARRYGQAQDLLQKIVYHEALAATLMNPAEAQAECERLARTEGRLGTILDEELPAALAAGNYGQAETLYGEALPLTAGNPQARQQLDDLYRPAPELKELKRAREQTGISEEELVQQAQDLLARFAKHAAVKREVGEVVTSLLPRLKGRASEARRPGKVNEALEFGQALERLAGSAGLAAAADCRSVVEGLKEKQSKQRELLTVYEQGDESARAATLNQAQRLEIELYNAPEYSVAGLVEVGLREEEAFPPVQRTLEEHDRLIVELERKRDELLTVAGQCERLQRQVEEFVGPAWQEQLQQLQAQTETVEHQLQITSRLEEATRRQAEVANRLQKILAWQDQGLARAERNQERLERLTGQYQALQQQRQTLEALEEPEWQAQIADALGRLEAQVERASHSLDVVERLQEIVRYPPDLSAAQAAVDQTQALLARLKEAQADLEAGQAQVAALEDDRWQARLQTALAETQPWVDQASHSLDVLERLQEIGRHPPGLGSAQATVDQAQALLARLKETQADLEAGLARHREMQAQVAALEGDQWRGRLGMALDETRGLAETADRYLKTLDRLEEVRRQPPDLDPVREAWQQQEELLDRLEAARAELAQRLERYTQVQNQVTQIQDDGWLARLDAALQPLQRPMETAREYRETLTWLEQAAGRQEQELPRWQRLVAQHDRLLADLDQARRELVRLSDQYEEVRRQIAAVESLGEPEHRARLERTLNQVGSLVDTAREYLATLDQLPDPAELSRRIGQGRASVIEAALQAWIDKAQSGLRYLHLDLAQHYLSELREGVAHLREPGIYRTWITFLEDEVAQAQRLSPDQRDALFRWREKLEQGKLLTDVERRRLAELCNQMPITPVYELWQLANPDQAMAVPLSPIVHQYEEERASVQNQLFDLLAQANLVGLEQQLGDFDHEWRTGLRQAGAAWLAAQHDEFVLAWRNRLGQARALERVLQAAEHQAARSPRPPQAALQHLARLETLLDTTADEVFAPYADHWCARFEQIAEPIVTRQTRQRFIEMAEQKKRNYQTLRRVASGSGL